MVEQDLEIIPQLIFKHLNGKLSEGERLELQEWVDKSERNKLFFQQATGEAYEGQMLADLKGFNNPPPDNTEFARTLAKATSEAKVVGIRPWQKYAAIAASVIVVVTTGAYLLNKTSSYESPIAKNNAAQHTSDVAPGHDGAILTLADGKTIVLDSMAAGVLATQGNSRVVLADGKLSYTDNRNKTANGVHSDKVLMNQLATPRGRKFHIELPDGSVVWMNALSTLRYPAQFTGAQRKVEITGEAYFEVAHNVAKPFIVHVSVASGDVDVTVLGTHFNVMAYKDEDAMKTTLLEGRVAISRPMVNGQRPTILKPGQEAQVTNDIAVSDDVDTDEAISWKNGLLSYHHADVKSVMRQLARWYDVDVVYEGNFPQRSFSGKLPTNQKLSELLKILELNSIYANIDGRVLTVKP